MSCKGLIYHLHSFHRDYCLEPGSLQQNLSMLERLCMSGSYAGEGMRFAYLVLLYSHNMKQHILV